MFFVFSPRFFIIFHIPFAAGRIDWALLADWPAASGGGSVVQSVPWRTAHLRHIFEPIFQQLFHQHATAFGAGQGEGGVVNYIYIFSRPLTRPYLGCEKMNKTGQNFVWEFHQFSHQNLLFFLTKCCLICGCRGFLPSSCPFFALKNPEQKPFQVLFTFLMPLAIAYIVYLYAIHRPTSPQQQQQERRRQQIQQGRRGERRRRIDDGAKTTAKTKTMPAKLISSRSGSSQLAEEEEDKLFLSLTGTDESESDASQGGSTMWIMWFSVLFFCTQFYNYFLHQCLFVQWNRTPIWKKKLNYAITKKFFFENLRFMVSRTSIIYAKGKLFLVT